MRRPRLKLNGPNTEAYLRYVLAPHRELSRNGNAELLSWNPLPSGPGKYAPVRQFEPDACLISLPIESVPDQMPMGSGLRSFIYDGPYSQGLRS